MKALLSLTHPCRYKILERPETSQSSYTGRLQKVKKVRSLAGKLVISDSDDDFESPSKLFRTSDIKQASPSPSYNPIQPPEVQSVHGPCSARFALFEYRLAKVGADLVESEQFSCILKTRRKRLSWSGHKTPSLKKELDRFSNVRNITATLPLAISPCCKIVLAQTGCTQLPVIPSLVELLDKLRE